MKAHTAKFLKSISIKEIWWKQNNIDLDSFIFR